jgi:hypothetical protein
MIGAPSITPNRRADYRARLRQGIQRCQRLIHALFHAINGKQLRQEIVDVEAVRPSPGHRFLQRPGI